MTKHENGGPGAEVAPQSGEQAHAVTHVPSSLVPHLPVRALYWTVSKLPPDKFLSQLKLEQWNYFIFWKGTSRGWRTNNNRNKQEKYVTRTAVKTALPLLTYLHLPHDEEPCAVCCDVPFTTRSFYWTGHEWCCYKAPLQSSLLPTSFSQKSLGMLPAISALCGSHPPREHAWDSGTYRGVTPMVTILVSCAFQ